MILKYFITGIITIGALSFHPLQAKMIPSVLLENYRYEIHAHQAGLVKLLIKKGDRVQQNTPLLELDTQELQIKLELTTLKVAKNQARLKQLQIKKKRNDQKRARKQELAQLKLSQQKALHTAGGLSNNGLRLAQIDYDLETLRQEEDDLTLAELDLKESKLKLKQLLFKQKQSVQTAPASGQITDLFVRSGEWVNSGQKVMELLSINPLFAKIMIPIKQAASLKKDQVVKIVINQGRKTIKAKGTVNFISDEVDPLDQTIKIFIKINNDQLLYKPGTRLRINVP